MKNIIYIIGAILCLLSAYACSNRKSESEDKGCGESISLRQDRFEVYGNIDSGLNITTRRRIIERFGEPDTSMKLEYPDCYDRSGRRILPLHNRYLNHLDMMFSVSVWHNIEKSGEDLIVYYEQNYYSSSYQSGSDSAFWAIRCAPEEVDSVLSLYTED